MANTRKPLIQPGTVASPTVPSLMDSIINRDRTQGGRGRQEPQPEPAQSVAGGNSDGNTGGNSIGNTGGNTSSNTASNTPSSVPPVDGTDLASSTERRSAVVGSRPKIAMTTITVRIPTELNQWIADYVHERATEGITKQDVIVAALRMLRSHEEAVES